MRTRLWPAVLALLALGSSACVMAPLQPGYTECGDFMGDDPCQPGQYCADATLSYCEPGCTSDVNCASNQECVKEYREQVGTCLNICTSCEYD
ncbi:hypothetical protein [Myxococcus virescens]|nr:hypothetical protein [Myxococcus virescens]